MKKKVVAVFNNIDQTNIGFENFKCVNLALKSVSYIGQCDFSLINEENKKFSTVQGSNVICTHKVESIINWLNYLKKYNVGLLHAHHTKAILFSTIVKTVLRLGFVVTVHSDFRHYNLKQKLVFFLGLILSDRIVCNSYNTKGSLPRFVDRAKIQVIYNGVNLEEINKPSRKARKESSKKIVLSVACRFVPVKDLETLVKAFGLVLKRTSLPLILEMAGDGPERFKLEKLLSDLGISKQVKIHGMLPRNDVYKMFSRSEIFLVTSKWEGFCNAMVEAAAAGNAIIASRINPLVEVIGENNAEFFPVGDSDSLCSKIINLAENNERRENLAATAQKFVCSKYSLQNSALQYRNVYQSVVNEVYSFDAVY